MATVHDSRHKPTTSKPSADHGQLHRDRVNMVLVMVVFGGLIALTLWLASLSPAPVGYPGFPLVP